MGPIIVMVLVSELLHRWLGWDLWVGVALVCLISTGHPLVRLLSDSSAPMKFRVYIGLQAVGGTLIAAAISYVSMVTAHYYWMHTPSW